jgi:hypothetical protein
MRGPLRDAPTTGLVFVGFEIPFGYELDHPPLTESQYPRGLRRRVGVLFQLWPSDHRVFKIHFHSPVGTPPSQ